MKLRRNLDFYNSDRFSLYNFCFLAQSADIFLLDLLQPFLYLPQTLPLLLVIPEILCKQERHERVRSVNDRLSGYALLKAHHIGTGIELEPYQIFADDYNGHTCQPKASSGFEKDHSMFIHVYLLIMRAVVQIADEYLTLQLLWLRMYFTSFQGYFVVIGIEIVRFLRQRRNSSLPFLQTIYLNSPFVDFQSFPIRELTLLIIDHIYCTVIHKPIQIKGNSSKSSLIGQVNHMIILRNMEVLPDQFLRLMVDVSEVFGAMRDLREAEFCVIVVPEGSVDLGEEGWGEDGEGRGEVAHVLKMIVSIMVCHRLEWKRHQKQQNH